ncbi:DNA polymerase III subunit delta' [Methylomonas sp. LL1]|uniref:DNA polymerase III subunit delta' n=1 Tax=Methylomonas sp. LL1 TaxID=2785785 RepID=UPI0018C44239|nr:DNA polymerase III subunit delta' [Methylomonas sp. LL1]QPK63446.1 DNA polymerase III subunit delta' [Methylomonas sp. LL1]
MKSAHYSAYPWQQTIWQHLSGYIEQQRIPQALLVVGSQGVGNSHLADVYARALLCHAPLADHSACGHCHGCKLCDARTHPDYLLIEPDEPGKGIGIDKIRRLIVNLALKPQFDAYRLVIIDPADRLNNAAANAFLKCLEEPTERTCLVLLTENPSRLPATIRSRCQTLHCPAPDKHIAGRWLQQQGVPGQNVDLLLSLSQGAPLLAKQYAEQNFIDLRQTYFKTWVQVAEGKSNPVPVAEQWQKQDALDLKVLLAWMLGWVMDMIKFAHGADTRQLHNPDMKKSLQALAERLELTGLYPFYDSLLNAKSQLGTQINKQLMLEQLLIRWSQLNI